jgi:hypothetical protein
MPATKAKAKKMGDDSGVQDTTESQGKAALGCQGQFLLDQEGQEQGDAE